MTRLILTLFPILIAYSSIETGQKLSDLKVKPCITISDTVSHGDAILIVSSVVQSCRGVVVQGKKLVHNGGKPVSRSFITDSVKQVLIFKDHKQVSKYTVPPPNLPNEFNAYKKDHCSVEYIHYLKGTVQNLYLIRYAYAFNELWTLYAMNGRMLWYKLESKDKPLKSGNEKIIFKKSGIRENFLECEDCLRHSIVLRPLL